jgi:glycosyltransferase involved in cell wall biosynthesis
VRVLHVHSGNLFGGVETMLLTLVQKQSLCPEMETQFALCFEARFSAELAANGVSYFSLGSTHLSRPLSVLRARRKLRSILEENRFDLAVVHSTWTQAIFGSTIRSFSVPLVFWVHDVPEGMPWPERWARRSPPPDFVVCNSEYTAGRLPKLYPRVRSRVVYCPVAPPAVKYSSDEIKPIRRQFQTPDNAIVILQISRMEPHKGHLVHLEALASLRDVPDWICWQVGDVQKPEERGYYESVKAAAVELGISDRVRFLGWQPDIQKVIAACDIYCQPNLYPEPFGITFIEALYAGKPVVATALGGPKEIVDNTCGFLVAPESHSIADALSRLVSDATLRTRLGENGPARAREICDPANQIQFLRDTFLVARNGFS